MTTCLLLNYQLKLLVDWLILYCDHLWGILKHAVIVAVVWHHGLLGMFLKQRLTMSDYATYPFDFHKLFTLQKLWQRLLSCAEAFYICCVSWKCCTSYSYHSKKEREGGIKDEVT